MDDKMALEMLGYISAELAERAGAYDGKAPEWFPQPPEWLTLWEDAEAKCAQ